MRAARRPAGRSLHGLVAGRPDPGRRRMIGDLLAEPDPDKRSPSDERLLIDARRQHGRGARERAAVRRDEAAARRDRRARRRAGDHQRGPAARSPRSSPRRRCTRSSASRSMTRSMHRSSTSPSSTARASTSVPVLGRAWRPPAAVDADPGHRRAPKVLETKAPLLSEDVAERRSRRAARAIQGETPKSALWAPLIAGDDAFGVDLRPEPRPRGRLRRAPGRPAHDARLEPQRRPRERAAARGDPAAGSRARDRQRDRPGGIGAAGPCPAHRARGQRARRHVRSRHRVRRAPRRRAGDDRRSRTTCEDGVHEPQPPMRLRRGPDLPDPRVAGSPLLLGRAATTSASPGRRGRHASRGRTWGCRSWSGTRRSGRSASRARTGTTASAAGRGAAGHARERHRRRRSRMRGCSATRRRRGASGGGRRTAPRARSSRR